MKIFSHILIGLIRAYQLTFGAVQPMSCRYWPTCSTYAREAVERHGAARGAWLALLRILRCNPWRPGGVDPVPESVSLPAWLAFARRGGAEPDHPTQDHA